MTAAQLIIMSEALYVREDKGLDDETLTELTRNPLGEKTRG